MTEIVVQTAPKFSLGFKETTGGAGIDHTSDGTELKHAAPFDPDHRGLHCRPGLFPFIVRFCVQRLRPSSRRRHTERRILTNTPAGLPPFKCSPFFTSGSMRCKRSMRVSLFVAQRKLTLSRRMTAPLPFSVASANAVLPWRSTNHALIFNPSSICLDRRQAVSEK